ncbi:MAG: tetratricopeptide repeat protein, partial [Planctomycetota bacterium]
GLITLAVLAFTPREATGGESDYDAGQRLLKEEKFSEALAVAEKIIRDPELAPFGRYLRGQALHLTSRYAEARDAFLRAAGEVESGTELAVMAVRYAATSEALRAERGPGGAGPEGESWRIYDEALRIDPDCTYALIRRGMILAGYGEGEEARESLGRVLRVEGSSKRDRAIARFWIGTLEIEEGNLGAARKSFADALSDDPEFAQARTSLEKMDKTLEAIRRTLRTETRLAWTLTLVLAFYLVSGVIAFRLLRRRELL